MTEYEQYLAERKALFAMDAAHDVDPIGVVVRGPRSGPLTRALLRPRRVVACVEPAPVLPVLDPACMDRGS